MRYECWKDDLGLSFIPSDSLDRDWIIKNSEFQFSIEANSWEDAMEKYHEKMGWEPYKPFED